MILSMSSRPQRFSIHKHQDLNLFLSETLYFSHYLVNYLKLIASRPLPGGYVKSKCL